MTELEVLAEFVKVMDTSGYMTYDPMTKQRILRFLSDRSGLMIGGIVPPNFVTSAPQAPSGGCGQTNWKPKDLPEGARLMGQITNLG